jgi:hypothetical protein
VKFKPVVALLALLLAGCSTPAAAARAGVGAPEVYNSGDFSELVTYLPVSRWPAPYIRTVVFCVDLGDAPLGGEVLFVHADMEVTNNLSYNLSFETHIMLTTSCAAVDGGEISESNGTNVHPHVDHHGVASRAGSLVVEVGNSRRYVNLIAFAGSNVANPGDQLKVEQDMGRLTVLRWR